jgi:hypothetical protein
MEVLTIPLTPVWANNTSGSAIGHPLTEALPSARVKSARVSIELRQRTGNLVVQVYYEYSADGLSWSGATVVGSSQGDNGVTSATTFTDVSSGAKRFIRWGIRAWNSSGTSLNLGNASARIETRQT